MIALAIRHWYFFAIAALVAVIGAQELRVNHAQTQLAQFKQEASDAARKSAELARAESERRQKVFDDEAASARGEKASLEADVSRLADVTDGLRGDLDAFRQRAKQSSKVASGIKSQSGPDPLDVLSQLFYRSSEVNRELAQFADALKLAGASCERSADKVASP